MTKNFFCCVKTKDLEILEARFKGDTEGVYIFGGDGTYLRALASYDFDRIPKVYAFNMGHVGMLLPLSPADPQVIIEKIEKKMFRFAWRQRLFVRSHNTLFTNEIVIRSESFKLNLFKITIDGYTFDIRGDGIIISTSAGSTGYNASLGGPIVLSRNILLNCAAPNKINFRPLVLPITSKIRIETSGCVGFIDTIRFTGDVYEIEHGDDYQVAIEHDHGILTKATKIFY